MTMARWILYVAVSALIVFGSASAAADEPLGEEQTSAKEQGDSSHDVDAPSAIDVETLRNMVVDAATPSDDEDQKLSVTLDGVEFDEASLLPGRDRPVLSGRLDGDVEVTIDATTHWISEGELRVNGAQIVVDAIIFQGDWTPLVTRIPRLDFGDVQLEMTFENIDEGTRAVVEKLRARGRDIRLDAWGVVDVTDNEIRPQLKLRFQVNRDYVHEHNLEPLFNVALVREAEYEAWYGFEITGSTGDLEVDASTDVAQGPEGAR